MGENPHAGHRERLRSLFVSHGLDAMPPHQVLEFLLFYAIPRKDTNVLAHRLIDTFGSLEAVLNATVEQLCRVEGISVSSASLLSLCGQLSLRCLRDHATAAHAFDNPADVISHLANFFADAKEERVVLLCLNNRLEPLRTDIIARGTVGSVELNNRAVCRLIMDCQASNIVLAHNHPGGFAIPSSEDIEVTAALQPLMSALDVQFLDHLIFADGTCTSLRSEPTYAPLFSTKLQETDRKDNRKECQP